MLLDLDLQPGLFRNGTQYASKGRYYDADLYRFYQGTELPVGGWRVRSASAATGTARSVLSWVDNSGQTWTAVGSNTGLFVYTRSGARHNITPAAFVAGRADATTGGGFGAGLFGAGTFGTPRPDSTNILPAMVWSLDIWGEYLIACDGTAIYQWTLNTAVIAAPLTNAPTARYVFVTDERVVMALGAGGNPRKIEWSDTENNTVWTPTGTNRAGGYQIQTTGTLLCGKRIRGGYLIFSDTDAHFANYVNLPDVYAFDRIATGCGVISQQGVCVVDGRAFWIGTNNFWQFNGAVDPLDCDIGDDLFANLNKGQGSKVHAWNNSQFGEVWFHYPSGGAIEIDRYVIYNYREGHWNRGRLVRLASADKSPLTYPVMVGFNGITYEHEIGQARDGRQPFVLSGPAELGTGERTMEIETIIPDLSNAGDVTFAFVVGDWPLDTSVFNGPYSSTAKTDVRLSGRRIAVLKTAAADIDFRVGKTRFAVKPGSPR